MATWTILFSSVVIKTLFPSPKVTSFILIPIFIECISFISAPVCFKQGFKMTARWSISGWPQKIVWFLENHPNRTNVSQFWKPSSSLTLHTFSVQSLLPEIISHPFPGQNRAAKLPIPHWWHPLSIGFSRVCKLDDILSAPPSGHQGKTRESPNYKLWY